MKKIIEITFEQLKSHFENLGFTECIHYENSQAFDFYKTINDVQYYIGLVYFKEKSHLYFSGVIHSYIISKEVNRILEKFTKTKGIREHALIKFPLYSKNIDDPFLNQLEILPLNTKDSF